MIIEDDASSGPVPTRIGRPPSPASTGSAITVGTSQQAVLIKSLEQGEYVPDDDCWDDTRSLTDSIRQHIIDGGLRYHAYHAGQYAFPNDETEQYRDDLKHNLTIHLCEGRYYYAPVHELLQQPGVEVLDLGKSPERTGTGKWCIELADMYPNATFHGMDLSPIQPDWVPENVLFVVDDIEHEAGWTHLKPGGYIEVQEFQYAAACDDDSCNEPYAWRDFLRYMGDGLAALGSDLNAILSVQDELAAAGFKGLRRTDLKCPNGPWPKLRRLQECGHILRDVIMWGLVGLARRPFHNGLGWTPIQIEMFLVDVRKSIIAERNGLPKFHSYFPFHNIYGHKPLDAA
ncbi:methyltransferase [Trichoderma arundinaceum]|uniref:Methyltransferase n=1 Tax=Trichoderma arundinaceum TaxID=490622 RepID=A0A395NYP6_TRIAR|nr:methyltransferase [Trichoderma arundinaceum]